MSRHWLVPKVSAKLKDQFDVRGASRFMDSNMMSTAHLSRVGKSTAVAFQPDDLPNLIGWHDAAVGITKDGGNLIEAWTDRSAAGNDVSQTTAANKPLWVDAVVNGKPVVRISDTSDYLDGPSALGITQPYHGFIVLKMRTWANGRPIVQFTNPLMNQSTTTNSVKLTDNVADNGPDLVLDLTNFFLVSYLFNGTSSTIAKNNDTPIGNANDLDGNLTTIIFGHNGGVSALVDIAESVIYSVEITGTDLTNVKNYLNNKFSLW